MKKLLCILFSIVILLGITGCGKEETEESNEELKKSYVTYESGEKYTFKELSKIAKENNLAFKEKYCSVPATLTAEVTKIKDTKIKDYDGKIYLEIWLEGTDSWSNYTAKIDYEKYKDLLLNLKTGDYLTLQTNNIQCKFYTDFSRFDIFNPVVTMDN